MVDYPIHRATVYDFYPTEAVKPYIKVKNYVYMVVKQGIEVKPQ